MEDYQAQLRASLGISIGKDVYANNYDPGEEFF
jgi:hypothetical protein